MIDDDDLLTAAKRFLEQNRPMRNHQAGGLIYKLIMRVERLEAELHPPTKSHFAIPVHTPGQL